MSKASGWKLSAVTAGLPATFLSSRLPANQSIAGLVLSGMFSTAKSQLSALSSGMKVSGLAREIKVMGGKKLVLDEIFKKTSKEKQPNQKGRGD